MKVLWRQCAAWKQLDYFYHKQSIVMQKWWQLLLIKSLADASQWKYFPEKNHQNKTPFDSILESEEERSTLGMHWSIQMSILHSNNLTIAAGK